MRIQIYHFYSNEVIETYESVEDAAQGQKTMTSVIFRCASQGGKILGETWGARDAAETIPNRVRKRIDYYKKKLNYREILKELVSTRWWKTQNNGKAIEFGPKSLTPWITTHKVSAGRSAKRGRNQQKKAGSQLFGPLLSARDKYIRLAVVLHLQCMFRIRRDFGNPHQPVDSRSTKLGARPVWRIDPKTYKLLERFNNVAEAEKKWGKSVEPSAIRRGCTIQRIPLASGWGFYHGEEGDDHLIGTVADITFGDVWCKTPGCGKKVLGSFHQEKCPSCLRGFKNNIPSVIKTLVNACRAKDKKCKKCKRPTTVTAEELIENFDGTCPCCGCEIGVDVGLTKDPDVLMRLNSISLDSMTPGVGHLTGKCRITCGGCNQLKNDAPERELVAFNTMFKTNTLDLSFMVEQEYQLHYVSKILDCSHKLQEAKDLFQKMKDSGFRGPGGFPYIPVVLRDKVDGGETKKPACIFAPSRDRIDNDNKSHDITNINVTAAGFNFMRNRNGLAETINALRRKFPEWDPEKLKITWPSWWKGWDHWFANTTGYQARAQKNAVNCRNTYGTDERLEELVTHLQTNGVANFKKGADRTWCNLLNRKRKGAMTPSDKKAYSILCKMFTAHDNNIHRERNK